MSLKKATLKESVNEAMEYFLEAMPDVPFTRNHIKIIFSDEEDRLKDIYDFTAKYAPDELPFTYDPSDIEAQDEYKYVLGEVVVSEKKSGVFLPTEYNESIIKFKKTVFHELTHIYFIKLENKVSPEIKERIDNPADDPDDDELFDIGYFIWQEFVATYYAIILSNANKKQKIEDDQIAETINNLVTYEMSEHFSDRPRNISDSSAEILSCEDILDILEMIPITNPHLSSIEKEYIKLLKMLYFQIEKKRPWEITVELMEKIGALAEIIEQPDCLIVRD